MIDLKELMEDRSAAATSYSQLRLAQVHQKIRRRRRNLTVATACTVVVVLASFGGYQFLRADPPTPPAVSASAPPAGPAAYELGRRLMAHGMAPLSAQTVSVSWTPTADNTIIQSSCHDVDSVEVYVEFLLNGKRRHSGLCENTIFTSVGTWPELRAGQPVTLVVNAVGATRTDVSNSEKASVPVPAIGALEVVVRQEVPFEQVPLPPRPAHLKPLREYPCQGVQSDPADPRRPVSISLLWTEALAFIAESQTPGELELTIDEQPMFTLAFWDYELNPRGAAWDTARPETGTRGFVPPNQGETVTFTVAARHVTGAWQVKFARYERGGMAPMVCGPDR
jgi:hypothetical protein